MSTVASTSSIETSDQEAIALLQQAIGIDTVSFYGDEHAMARLLKKRLEQANISCEIHIIDERRANLVARVRSANPGPCVVLSGHMDTVPIGSVPWEHAPFDAEIHDGYLYGRGAVDMKSGLLALMHAFIRFAEYDASSWSGELIFAATSTEETGAEGAKIMVQKEQIPVFDAMIIGEPTDMRLVIAHKGALWTRVCSCGHASHSSMPEQGVNAIDKLFPFYSRLSEVDLTTSEHTLLSRPTIAVTLINGGKQTNVIPDRCDMTLDIRTVPEQSHAALQEQMRSFVAEIMRSDEAANLELETLLDLPGMLTDPTAGIVAFAREVLLETSNSAEEATPQGAQYFTDASVLQALGKDIIVLGPGNPRLAHQVNEHVSLNDYISCIDIYEKILKKYMKIN